MTHARNGSPHSERRETRPFTSSNASNRDQAARPTHPAQSTSNPSDSQQARVRGGVNNPRLRARTAHSGERVRSSQTVRQTQAMPSNHVSERRYNLARQRHQALTNEKKLADGTQAAHQHGHHGTYVNQQAGQRDAHAQMASLSAPKKKMSRGKKIALSIVAAFLVAILGIGAAGAAYMSSIKSSLGYDGDVDALKGALSLADYADPFYVLVIGSDNWEDYGARSDAMVLARVDLNNAQVTMVSVPRDTPYQINGQTVKLNQVFSEKGEIACIEAVSELTGVDIAHYVEVEFDQLESVVDSLGGVRVNVPYTFDYQVYTKDEPIVHVDAGEQVLTGEQAVAFARMRTAYTDANIGEDAIRQANIRAMMVGMIKQVLNQPATEIPSQIQKLAAMVKTDIPLDELISWATALAQADKVTLYSCTGPTEGGIDDATGLWLTEEAPEQWAELMRTVDSGKDPTTAMEASSDGQVQLGTSETL